MKNKLIVLITFLAYIFLIGPLVVIVVSAFGDNKFLEFPPSGFTIEWFINVFHVGNFVDSCIISAKIAFLSTVLAVLIGVPAAYAITRYDFPFKKIIKMFLDSPILIPGIVLGFTIFRYIVQVLNTPIFTSLLIGHTFLVIPYVLRNVSATIISLDVAIEEAAWSLGASHLKTLAVIVLPNIKSGIVAACILSVVNSFNNVPIATFLTGPGVSTLPMRMLAYVEYNYDPTVAALSTMLMMVTILIMVVVDKSLGLDSIS